MRVLCRPSQHDASDDRIFGSWADFIFDSLADEECSAELSSDKEELSLHIVGSLEDIYWINPTLTLKFMKMLYNTWLTSGDKFLAHGGKTPS